MNNGSTSLERPSTLRDYSAPEAAEFSRLDLEWLESITCDVVFIQSPEVLALTSRCGGKKDYHIQIDPMVYPRRVGDGPQIEVPIGYGFYFSRNSGKEWRFTEKTQHCHGPDGIDTAHNTDFLVCDPARRVREGCAIGMTETYYYDYKKQFDTSESGTWYYLNRDDHESRIGWFINDNLRQVDFYHDNRGIMNLTIAVFQLKLLMFKEA